MTILVYTENREGRLIKAAFELISYAKEVAQKTNARVVALSIGDVNRDELMKTANYGATRVVTINDEKLSLMDNKRYISVVAEVAEKEQAEIILLPDNTTGKALTPGLSAKLKAGLVSGVASLPQSYDPFIVKKKVYSGKSIASVKILTDRKILTLPSNSFGVIEPESNGEPQIEEFTPDADMESKINLVSMNKVTDKILLSEAEIVVSGGRGMKGPENWGMIEELAGLLNAATACSRPVSDEGWRPHSEHVGQTGKVIAPNLYIACGISGAIQHVAGISSSKCIVAINKDDEAPIFDVADYGIVGDVQKVLPQLTQAIKAIKEA